MIEISEIEINLARFSGGGRRMRLVHRPTGIAVEKELKSDDGIVASRNILLAELEKRKDAAAGPRQK